jgi:hypothetical protein
LRCGRITFTTCLATCHYRSTSFSKVPSRTDKETSTIANGSKSYESMRRKTMVIHEHSNKTTYRTLSQSCTCNLVVATTLCPRSFVFDFILVKREVKQLIMIISAVTVHNHQNCPTPHKEDVNQGHEHYKTISFLSLPPSLDFPGF